MILIRLVCTGKGGKGDPHREVEVNPVAYFADADWVRHMRADIIPPGDLDYAQTNPGPNEWREWRWASRNDRGRPERFSQWDKPLRDTYQFSCRSRGCHRSTQLSKANLVKLLEFCRDKVPRVYYTDEGKVFDTSEVKFDISDLPF